MRKIIFIVPPEVQLLDLNGPVHVFYEANENGALLDLQYVSIYKDSHMATSCAGLQFVNLVSYHDMTLFSGDYIFVPGITFSLLTDISFKNKCRGFLNWLADQHAKSINICSVCTGAFFLAEAGILNEKMCTTHWNRIDDFSKRYQEIIVVKNKLFIKDENVYTSAGVSAGIDLALHIIEKEFGIKFAIDVAKQMVIYFRRGESDSQINAFLQFRNHMDDRIHNAQNYILKNLEHSFQVDDIAEEVGMSGRNLIRLFKKTTGITIGSYRENLRVERASQLLAENNTVTTVASACGLKSVSHLRSLLKKHKSILPSEFHQ